MSAHFSLALALGFAVASPCAWAHDTLSGAQARLDKRSGTASLKPDGKSAAVIPEEGDLHFWVLGNRAKRYGVYSFYAPQLSQDQDPVKFTEGDTREWVMDQQKVAYSPKDSWDKAWQYFGLHCIWRHERIHVVSPLASKSVWGYPRNTPDGDWSQNAAALAAGSLLFSESQNSRDASSKVEVFLRRLLLERGSAPKQAAPETAVLITGKAQSDEPPATTVDETAPAVIPREGDLHFWVLGFRAKPQGVWSFGGPQLIEDPAIVVFTEKDAHDWIESSQGREQTPENSWAQAKAFFGLHCIRRAGRIHRVSSLKSHSVWGKPSLNGDTNEDWSQAGADDAARILLFRMFGDSQIAHGKVEAYLKKSSPKKALPQKFVLIKGQAQTDEAPNKVPRQKGRPNRFLSKKRNLAP